MTAEKQADDLATFITNLAFDKGARLRNQDYINVRKECLKAITTLRKESEEAVVEARREEKLLVFAEIVKYTENTVNLNRIAKEAIAALTPPDTR